MFAFIKKLFAPPALPPALQALQEIVAPVPPLPSSHNPATPAIVAKATTTACLCRSCRPICVRCLVPAMNAAELSRWSLVTVEELPGKSFHFCPQCGLNRGVPAEDNLQRLHRCRRWVGRKIKAESN